MIWDTDHKEKVFHQYGFLYESSNYYSDQMILDTDHNQNGFL